MTIDENTAVLDAPLGTRIELIAEARYWQQHAHTMESWRPAELKKNVIWPR